MPAGRTSDSLLRVKRLWPPDSWRIELSAKSAFLSIQYHSMQLGETPLPSTLQDELQAAYDTLLRVSVVRIQAAVRMHLARQYVAEKVRKYHGTNDDARAEDEAPSEVGSSARGARSEDDTDDTTDDDDDDDDTDDTDDDDTASSEEKSDEESDEGKRPKRPATSKAPRDERGYAQLPQGVHCGAIDLSLNQLVCLDASLLSPLEWLCLIDVSFNHLVSLDALGTQPLHCLCKLVAANNHLVSVKGANAQPSLTHLDVSYNALEQLDGVRELRKLRYLGVEANLLGSLEGLGHLKRLSTLVAHSNRLTSITGVHGAKALAKLDVSHCQLHSLDETTRVCSQLESLRHLALHGNVLADWEYLPRLIVELRSLESLDEVPLTARVRAHAKRVMTGRSADEVVADAHNSATQQLNAREDQFHRDMAQLEARQAQLRADFERSQQESVKQLAAYELTVRSSSHVAGTFAVKLAQLKGGGLEPGSKPTEPGISGADWEESDEDSQAEDNRDEDEDEDNSTADSCSESAADSKAESKGESGSGSEADSGSASESEGESDEDDSREKER